MIKLTMTLALTVIEVGVLKAMLPQGIFLRIRSASSTVILLSISGTFSGEFVDTWLFETDALPALSGGGFGVESDPFWLITGSDDEAVGVLSILSPDGAAAGDGGDGFSAFWLVWSVVAGAV